ncbi:unnamed protein product [Withania somnifera]
MSYKRVIGRKKCYGIRGIKLNSRRFSVQKVRVKLLCFFKILKKSYGNLLNLLKKNSSGRKERDHEKNLVRKKGDYKLKSFTHSNSFYAEAIADCLDFIKRNSLSIEEKPILCHAT